MNRFLQSARDAIDAAVEGVPPDVMIRGEDGRWSIVQILDHLTLAFEANAAALEALVSTGQIRARTPVLKQTLARILVVDLGYFPRVEAPKITRPRDTIPPDTALPAIRAALSRLDDGLAAAAARVGKDVPVANHPYFAGLTVPQWQKFHWRHTLHHMRQVRARAGSA